MYSGTRNRVSTAAPDLTGVGHVRVSDKSYIAPDFEINGQALIETMCGPEDKEAEAVMESRMKTLETIKGLLDSKRWEGLKVYIEARVAEGKYIYFNINVATTIWGYKNGPYKQISLWPEEDHWRVWRYQGNNHHSNVAKAQISLGDPGERVELKDIKKFLGKWKTEMRSLTNY